MNKESTEKPKIEETILCQECKNEFTHESPEGLKPGDKTQCPICGTTLAVTQKETREGKDIWRSKPIPEEK